MILRNEIYFIVNVKKIQIIIIIIKTQPLFFPNELLYPNPETPVLIEKPFVLIEPNFVLTLGVIPDLLIFKPNPLPKLIRLLNRNPIAFIFYFLLGALRVCGLT